MILEEHGQNLSALRSGQEHLKAELDGMKISNAKQFGSLKEDMGDLSAKVVLLRDESWENKKSIYRMQKTMGMQ
ncbi:hypothetical protein [Virgibacillus sp. L01]|uniref:hypothetical protein n=1 Tax=Virgibacillus sp. L01 TaxID=3457429 RepID=UPI003FD487C3